MPILFRPFGFLVSICFIFIRLSNSLLLSLPNESYSRYDSMHLIRYQHFHIPSQSSLNIHYDVGIGITWHSSWSIVIFWMGRFNWTHVLLISSYDNGHVALVWCMSRRLLLLALILIYQGTQSFSKVCSVDILHLLWNNRAHLNLCSSYQKMAKYITISPTKRVQCRRQYLYMTCEMFLEPYHKVSFQ